MRKEEDPKEMVARKMAAFEAQAKEAKVSHRPTLNHEPETLD